MSTGSGLANVHVPASSSLLRCYGIAESANCYLKSSGGLSILPAATQPNVLG